MSTKRYLLENTTAGKVKRHDFDEGNGLRQIQKIVGGWIEHIADEGVPFSRFDFWCNEEGKIEGLDPNLIATRIYKRDLIVGNVAVSASDQAGETQGISGSECKELIDALKEIGASV